MDVPLRVEHGGAGVRVGCDGHEVDQARADGQLVPDGEAEARRAQAGHLVGEVVQQAVGKGRIATWNAGTQLLKGYKTRRHHREALLYLLREGRPRYQQAPDGTRHLPARGPCRGRGVAVQAGRQPLLGQRHHHSRLQGQRARRLSKVTRDLTERKSAESRLIAAYEESEKLKSDFLANISHEIRTPIHGMLSAYSLLREMPLSDKQREIVSIMEMLATIGCCSSVL